VSRSEITIDDAVIAVGSFKTVHRGTLAGHAKPIAVLRMRQGGSCEEEAAKLVRLRRHPGLVQYLGICTDGPDQLLLTELATHGSLDQFLEDHEDDITLAHKLRMLQQVCEGMVALSGAGLAHRDLATRNILVFDFDAANPAATVVKITDFGLAIERHYQTHSTVPGDSVPFRWMSPEALRRRRFSEKSDVWAFGVTAWELLTGGDVPYAFIESNEAVAERVCGGERLARPTECPDALWTLLQRMWAERPADRPTFTDVASELAALTTSTSPVSQLQSLKLAEVWFTNDVQGCGEPIFKGPHSLPLTTTIMQLNAFASRVIGYPCHGLCLITWDCLPNWANLTDWAEIIKWRGHDLRDDTTSLALLVTDDEYTRPDVLQDEAGEHRFVLSDPGGEMHSKVCFRVSGPPTCMKCGIQDILGYARDEDHLPRFGGSSSFDNYDGTVQYILASKGNRRQCGRCWKNELGAMWEGETFKLVLSRKVHEDFGLELGFDRGMVMVSSITPNTPAARSGKLRVLDRIVRIDNQRGTRVDRTSDFQALLQNSTRVDLQVLPYDKLLFESETSDTCNIS
jgi:serine/threonine protein kinase